MDIAKNLFLFSFKKDFIVYNQLINSMVITNRSGVAVLQKLLKGEDCSLYHDFTDSLKPLLLPPRLKRIEKESKEFSPTSVTLFPSHSCQLRCIYCYADAGNSNVVMDFKIAKAAIDLISKNAGNKTKRINVSFHGGGEPFFGKGGLILEKSSYYAIKVANEKGVQCRLHSSTNGILNERQLKWIRDIGMNIQLSFDGPEWIQNCNRPLIRGNSFEKSLKTLLFFENNNINYSLRATIQKSKDLMDVVKFFSQVSSIKSLAVEPIQESGRAKLFGIKSPNEYASAFIEAKHFAKSIGWELKSSMDCNIMRNSFCGATNPNFCVTPEGFVSSCYEVSKLSDKLANVLIYGKYHSGNFVFDGKKIEYLRNRTVDKIEGCGNCQAKNYCAGDCLTKIGSDIYKIDDFYRCEIIKQNFRERLLLKAEDLLLKRNTNDAN